LFQRSQEGIEAGLLVLVRSRGYEHADEPRPLA
jgi:hypothetical protein